jgi:hypothetical protein
MFHRLGSNAYFHLIVSKELLFSYQNDLQIEQVKYLYIICS